MNEETAFDKLSKYLKNKNIEFSSHVDDKHYILFPSDPMSRKKFIVFKSNNCYFIANDSYSTKAYSSNTFSGLFCAIDLPKTFNLKMYKKHWVDLVLRTKKRKTGSLNIDKKVTITSSIKTIPSRLFDTETISKFLDLNEKFTPFKMIIEDDYIPFIKDLKGKMLVGIETDYWIFKEEELETLLRKGELLLNNMKKNASIIK